jgi:hypothetical protein
MHTTWWLQRIWDKEYNGASLQRWGIRAARNCYRLQKSSPPPNGHQTEQVALHRTDTQHCRAPLPASTLNRRVILVSQSKPTSCPGRLQSGARWLPGSCRELMESRFLGVITAAATPRVATRTCCGRHEHVACANDDTSPVMPRALQLSSCSSFSCSV